METNRIEEILRDPTLEQPTLTYHEVCLPWMSVLVRPEVAERVIEAVYGLHRAEWVRVETITGSVVHFPTEYVVFVREWTPAQRASEVTLSKALQEEWREAQGEDALEMGLLGLGPMPQDDVTDRDLLIGVVLTVLAVVGVSAVAASVASWIWIARVAVP